MDEDLIFDYLLKHKLTFTQFAIPYLKYKDEIEDRGDSSSSKGKHSLLYKYLHVLDENGERLKASDLDKLVKLKLIINEETRKDKINLNKITVTDKFIKDVFPTDIWDEFYEAYPGRVRHFDPSAKQKFILLKTSDPDVLEKIYKKQVKTIKKHKEIVEALKKSIEYGQFPNCTIEKYVVSNIMFDMIDAIKDIEENGGGGKLEWAVR